MSRPKRTRYRRGRRTTVEFLEPRYVLDSTVVFNEIMYNPVAAESREWIELHNQMSVNVDLSNWRIEGAVQYEFPAGTVLLGGEYLVIAADPTVVADNYGLSSVMGPFAGRLSNAGETIELRNHSNRLMNVLSYDDGQETVSPWPVGADGTGASLAKIEPQLATEDPTNWTASAQFLHYRRAIIFTRF